MELNDKENPLYWRDVFRECISNKIKSPLMLRKEGLILPIRCRPTGSNLMGNYWVRFDRDYLLRYLNNFVWKVFPDFSEQEVLDLVLESKEYEHAKKIDLSSIKSYQLRGEEVIRVADLKKALNQ